MTDSDTLGVGKEVTITRAFNARRELVFDVWTDEKHIASWFGPMHFTNPVVRMDVRPGGEFVIHMQGLTAAFTPASAPSPRSPRPSAWPSPRPPTPGLAVSSCWRT